MSKESTKQTVRGVSCCTIEISALTNDDRGLMTCCGTLTSNEHDGSSQHFGKHRYLSVGLKDVNVLTYDSQEASKESEQSPKDVNDASSARSHIFIRPSSTLETSSVLKKLAQSEHMAGVSYNHSHMIAAEVAPEYESLSTS